MSTTLESLTVSAPATSANLGPGFDCLAVALDVSNAVVIERRPGPLEVTVTGEGAGELAEDASNLFCRALASGLGSLDGLAVECRNRIPLGRGLGSSAAAVCAGLVAANALGTLRWTPDDLLARAAAIEGHADNAAACLNGGMIVVGRGRSRGRCRCPTTSAAIRGLVEEEGGGLDLVARVTISSTAIRATIPPSWVPEMTHSSGSRRRQRHCRGAGRQRHAAVQRLERQREDRHSTGWSSVGSAKDSIPARVNGPQIVLGGMRPGQGFTAGSDIGAPTGPTSRLSRHRAGDAQKAYLFDFNLDFQGLKTERTSVKWYTKYEHSPDIDFYGIGNQSQGKPHQLFVRRLHHRRRAAYRAFRHLNVGFTGGYLHATAVAATTTSRRSTSSFHRRRFRVSTRTRSYTRIGVFAYCRFARFADGSAKRRRARGAIS